ncbi:DUF6221 family protein [Nocardiopsis sp. NPDC101807]|uniref:DUF6221 family protein n=1 Tax=Nocardiopsis sp. NPDC101807 TaxID=3364339 RepID=UPI0038292FFC
MTLEEFLAARLKEEETLALEALGEHGYGASPWSFDEENGEFDFGFPNEHFNIGIGVFDPRMQHMVHHEPRKVLREIAAKREVVEASWAADGERAAGLVQAIRLLAAAYDTHPDYKTIQDI